MIRLKGCFTLGLFDQVNDQRIRSWRTILRQLIASHHYASICINARRENPGELEWLLISLYTYVILVGADTGWKVFATGERLQTLKTQLRGIRLKDDTECDIGGSRRALWCSPTFALYRRSTHPLSELAIYKSLRTPPPAATGKKRALEEHTRFRDAPLQLFQERAVFIVDFGGSIAAWNSSCVFIRSFRRMIFVAPVNVHSSSLCFPKNLFVGTRSRIKMMMKVCVGICTRDDKLHLIYYSFFSFRLNCLVLIQIFSFSQDSPC